MIYPQNFEQKVGFDKIRELLTENCLSALGRDRVQLMEFQSDYTLISEQLNQLKEFIAITQSEVDFPESNFFDIRSSIHRLRIDGTYLDESDLFNLKRSLETIEAISRFLSPESIDEEPTYPHLFALAKDVIVFPHIIRRIDALLDKFGRIKDSASPKLHDIRRELSQTMSSVSRSLNAILRTAQSEGFVDKDVAPTMRDGRLVIPVAPTFKRKIKGIVHDESASGKTVFIEPAVVVEANNRVRELENEERREIIRILTIFSDEIRADIEPILHSYAFLAEIDFIRAKTVLAIKLEAHVPVIQEKTQAYWYGAKHPLLFLSHKAQNKPIVPLDIELDEETRIVLISGPNAGGKSVCLKTMGLLQYMLQCGLAVCMYDHSTCGIFDDIFIDIGDEQSIENDLSTYSSHLTNMKCFSRSAGEKSLLLIDEFGGGTEPQIGGAIAQALLESFNQQGCYGIITTHYQNLKHFAEDTPGIVNGAMLYDRHLMKPLFKLSIGNPGSSFAIEIARKIGLPEHLIQTASEIVGSDYIDMDKYLQDIVRDKRYWENKRQKVRQQEKKLEESSALYEKQLLELDKQRKEIIKASKAEAEAILAQANTKIENTIREIKEAQADKEKTKIIRDKLNSFKADLKEDKELDDKIARKIQKIKDREKKQPKKGQTEVPAHRKQFKPDVIEEGDAVRIKGQSSIGEVIDVNGKQVTVLFGMIQSTIKRDKLEKLSKNQIKKEQPKAVYISANTADELREKKLHFKQDIDLRGMRVDEALQAVTYFIDDAILVGMSRVRILHGTGTGALRQMIRQYLATVSGVSSFRDEHVQFGGAGITVVDLE